MKLDSKKTKLANGLRITTAHIPHVDSVAMGIWVGVGGRYESKKYSGISHFIEHLLFKGTKTRSAMDISHAIEGRGGYFNAYTQEESTCYYARISSKHAYSVWGILSDMYRHPRFASPDIEKERSVIMEEIMMYNDQPHHVAHEHLGELMWKNHALGRPLIGTPQNISEISQKDIKQFKSEYYIPGKTVVALAGNVDHEYWVSRINESLGSVKKKPYKSCKQVTSKTPQSSLYMERRQIDQNHLAMGMRVFGRKDPKRYALKLLSIILGENMSSRLFQIVRERHGLAYSISSGTQLFHDTGGLVVSAGLDRSKTIKAIHLIFKELERFKIKKVSHSELRRAKDYAIGQLNIGLENTISQMTWCGDHLLNDGYIQQPEEVIDHFEKVSREDIYCLMADILKKESLSISLVLSEKTPDLQNKIEEIMASLP
jgi:predicted Zn-dependent peptidase